MRSCCENPVETACGCGQVQEAEEKTVCECGQTPEVQENSCCGRQTVRSAEEKKAITVRVNRIIGQLGGIKRMADEDRYCGDILIQLSAIDQAICSLAALMLDRHLHTCVAEKVREGDDQVMDEVVELFRRFR